jgi:hypothetical protein
MDGGFTMAKPVEVDAVWMQRIAEVVNGLEYGSVLITVHDGRIVQIDRTERKRFDAVSAAREKSGASAQPASGKPLTKTGEAKR